MLSFFGDKPKKAGAGPLVSKVIVKKVIPNKPGGSRGANAHENRAGPSFLNASTSSSKPTNASSSSKLPSHKDGLNQKASSAALKPTSPMFKSKSKDIAGNRSGSVLSSRSSTPAARKRRTPSPIRSESESDSDSSSDLSGSDNALDGQPRVKRRKVGRNGTATGASTPLGAGEESVGREVWCLGKVDERGEWGRGWVGFVRCEEVVRGQVSGWAGGGGEAKGRLEKYQAYFPQAGFENAEPLPSVELLYPASGCREKFILLAPTSPREYSPISELRSTLRMILNHYIPLSHAHIFGTLSSTDLDSAPLALPVPSRVATPNPTSALATPSPDSFSPAPLSSEPSSLPPLSYAQPSETIADALRKALAPNRRDGPGFLRAMERFNNALAEIQADGSMTRYLAEKSWGKGMRKDMWSGVVDLVHDQGYSRVVGPFSNELEHHPKHPDEVAKAISGKEDAYGELRHNFMSKIIEQAKLGPESNFVDLGSGVGNCVLQAALQAGSRSFGIELLPVPAHCARLQLRETQRRWAMWGLNGNLDVEFAEGDFRTHPAVPKRLREADVVLVNNEVFPPSLNANLTNMFLDLKEGAVIVSLKPFVPEGFRMNESNCDSFAAIVRMTQHTYYSDWVSWKGDSGRYYVQVIDRSMRRSFEVEMNGGRRR